MAALKAEGPGGAAVFGDGADAVEKLKAEYRALKTMLLKFDVANEITKFRHRLEEFIQDYFNPSLDLAVQRRRERALFEGRNKRAHDMFWLLYDALLYGHEPAEDEEPGQRVAHPDGDAPGFVGVRHMRMCIKAFVDPYIDVEGADGDYDQHFLANFMGATGFVNRLWDVRRIIEVYLDTGLDLETRRATVAAMLGELEELLKARATAVSTGRFELLVRP